MLQKLFIGYLIHGSFALIHLSRFFYSASSAFVKIVCLSQLRCHDGHWSSCI